MKGMNNKGFTLVEIIASLILVGILAAVAGFGLLRGTRALVYARGVSDVSQKGQMAMGRMTRTFRNITDINSIASEPISTSIAVTFDRDGSQETEQYSYNSNTLEITVGGNTYILAEDVSDFSFSYWKNDGTTPWTASPNSDLARIDIAFSMTMAEGTSVPFSAQVVPRNLYQPEDIANLVSGTPGINTGTSPCFITAAAFGTENYSCAGVSVIFLSLILLWYMAGRRQLILFPSKTSTTIMVNCQQGSVLIGVIATMVVVSVFGAGVITLLNTSTSGSITPLLNTRAYYNAESGYRYAGYTFTGKEGGDFDALKTLAGTTCQLTPENSFSIGIDSYWFETVGDHAASFSTLIVRAPYAFPDAYAHITAGTIAIDGYPIHIPVDSIDRDQPSPGQWTLNLSIAVPVAISAGTSVYPSFYASSTPGNVRVIQPDNNLQIVASNGSTTPLDAATFSIFPKLNGVITVTDGTNHYLLIYDRVDSETSTLTNVRNASSTLYALEDNTVSASSLTFILNKNVLITSTGTAGTGAYQATRSLKINLPLITGNMVINYKLDDSFDNLDNWNTGTALGGHTLTSINGDAAIQVSTAQGGTDVGGSTIATAYAGKDVQESFLELKQDLEFTNESGEKKTMEDLRSDFNDRLYYDLQVKIKFTAEEDSDTGNPLGTYMPGFLFRVRTPNEGYSDLREYYGLSFVRPLFDNNALGANPDPDDIPDDFLFEDPASSADLNYMCVNNPAGKSAGWDGSPMISGVPYILLWQKADDLDEYNSAYNPVWIRNYEELLTDWLAYMPLCGDEDVALYHYPSGSYTLGGGEELQIGESYLGNTGGFNNHHIFIDESEPATTDGTITRFKAYIDQGGGSFYIFTASKSGNDFTVRDSQRLVASDTTGIQTWDGLNLTCQSGDYLGIWTETILGDIVKFKTSTTGSQQYRDIFSFSDPVPGTQYNVPPGSKKDGRVMIFAESDIWCDAIITGDPRMPEIVAAKKLTTVYPGIVESQTLSYSGVDYTFDTGKPADAIVYHYDSGTTTLSVSTDAYVFPGQDVDTQKSMNYIIYLKEWVTLMARIMEEKDDFFDETLAGDCGNSSDERYNIIKAWFAGPDVYGRGDTLKWPEDESFPFTPVVWSDYNSKNNSAFHVTIGGSTSIATKRICERAINSTALFSNQLTSEIYDDPGASTPSEVGLHTFGIDSENSEAVYFDDFGLQVKEIGAAGGFLAGVQAE